MALRAHIRPAVNSVGSSFKICAECNHLPLQRSLSDSSHFSLGLSQESPSLICRFLPFLSIFYLIRRTRVWSIAIQIRSFLCSKPSRLSHHTQRKGQSSCSGLETCLFSHLELWPQLLPPTPSNPMPATPASLCSLNSPGTLLPNLPLLFPLPRTLFPQVSACLTFWVPLGVCSKVARLVAGCLALGYCLSSCDILLGVDTPTPGLCLAGYLVLGLRLAGFICWEAGEESKNMERAELFPPLCLPQALS